MDIARDRAEAGRAGRVTPHTSTSPAFYPLPRGWYEVKAFDAEIYVLTGRMDTGWSTTYAERIEPGSSEWYEMDSNNDGITVAVASGGLAQIVPRQR